MAGQARKQALSTKRVLIDKANSTVVVMVSVAVFILIFSLVASKALFSQAGYQNRVIGAKRVARDQLKEDLKTVAQLNTAYQAFTTTTTNIIGGASAGTGVQDGDNAKIILDALPSKYDFPALATNLDTLVSGQGAKLTTITGTDDEIAQSANDTSMTPQPIPMPFQLTATGDYPTIQKLISAFERSIRPIQLQKVDMSGSSSSLSVNITAQSYYQPAKSLNIGEKVIK